MRSENSMKNLKLKKLSALLVLFSSASCFAQANLNPLNKPYSLNNAQNVNKSTSAVSEAERQEEKRVEVNNLIENKQLNSIVENKINTSRVFGEWVFNGNFANNNIQGFNNNYKISFGDKIVVKLWGAVESDFKLVVDKQGNIFIPEVGPIKVIGIQNSELNEAVSNRIKKVYKNVQTYVSLDNEQPVKVYVSGFAKKPGLYSGLSSDSLLYYIDKAGGIDPDRGSFLEINVLRENRIKKTINLYDFLISGKIEDIQFSDGDVIQITPKNEHVKVLGDVRNAFEFEFKDTLSLKELMSYAKPESSVNKVFITRKNRDQIKTLSFNLSEINDLSQVKIENNDSVSLTIDKKVNTVSIKVEGEHDSEKEIVLPLGSTIQDLMNYVKKNDRTDLQAVQLFRQSVKERQKQSIEESIRLLEQNILSTNSSTKNAAELREKEANMLLKLIESARKVEPKGQVILENTSDFEQVYLEDGDRLTIGSKNSLVNVSGQVLQPTAFVWNNDYSIERYIENAGGYLANANTDKILVRKASGAIRMSDNSWNSGKIVIAKGDEIMVLPKVDMKNTQWIKDITELLYQVAVGAAVILKL